jgi:predicted transcriptional regulator
MKKLLLNLEPELFKQLSILALATGRSKTEIIRHAIQQIVAGNEKHISNYLNGDKNEATRKSI